MNETAIPRLATPMDRGFQQLEEAAGPQQFNAPAVLQGGDAIALGSFGNAPVAQVVPVPRNLTKVMAKLKTLCAISGEKYVYSWMVNDNANNRKEEISGPTIKLANDLAREYGNCVIDTRAIDEGTHWTIYARFTDLETGFSTTRPFQQRKSQRAGKKMDADRQQDIAFQIGTSKAIRNVVCNALESFADFMVEESERGLAKQVAENKDKVWEFIEKVMTKHQILIQQVEAVVGRVEAEWTVKDLTRVYMEMRGIHEGLSVARELYPTIDNAEAVSSAKKEKEAEARADAPSADKAEKQAAAGEGGKEKEPTAAKAEGTTQTGSTQSDTAGGPKKGKTLFADAEG